MAALDGLGMKVLELRMKQYGDKGKEQQVIDKRVENAQAVASYLIRDDHDEIAASPLRFECAAAFRESAAIFI